jgi:hypothetical protein
MQKEARKEREVPLAVRAFEHVHFHTVGCNKAEHQHFLSLSDTVTPIRVLQVTGMLQRCYRGLTEALRRCYGYVTGPVLDRLGVGSNHCHK